MENGPNSWPLHKAPRKVLKEINMVVVRNIHGKWELKADPSILNMYNFKKLQSKLGSQS